MPHPPNIELCITNWNDPASIQLRAAQRAEIVSTYHRPPGPEPSAEDIPIFIVLKIDSVPVACGGLRPILMDQIKHAAEIKRMYVLPEYRGSKAGKDLSLASLVLQELEKLAAARSWCTLRLGTGVEMAPARKFYERHGFYYIPLFGNYVTAPGSVCFEKVLDGGLCGLSPASLRSLVAWVQDISIVDLKRCARYKNDYSPKHPMIKNFWAVVEQFSQDECRHLLGFVAASDRVPVTGYERTMFQIVKVNGEPNHLPTSSTSFGKLYLPDYADHKILKEKLAS